MRLLLADDNPINQKVGLSVLQKLGYRADVANNGLEVLKALEQKAYDILFLDVQMPEMDGLEAARQICQRWPREKRPRIIAMTGNALMGDREKCLASRHGRLHLQAGAHRRIAKRARTLGSGPDPQARHVVLHALNVVAEGKPAGSEHSRRVARNAVRLTASAWCANSWTFSSKARRNASRRFSQTLNDPPKLAFHAHALKSMGLNLGAKRIVELSQKIEELGRSGKVTDAPDLLRELEIVFSQTKAHLLPLRDE